jgi:galactonate dehydratase
MACIEDFRISLSAPTPMQVEHIWQSMWVHSFYAAGPVMGSAMSAIDQALWDIPREGARCPGIQAAGRSRLTRAAFAATTTPDGVRTSRGSPEVARDRYPARRFLLQDRHSDVLRVDRDSEKISAAVKSMQMLRENLGPDIDIAGRLSPPRRVPAWASILVKEVEPLNLLFIEEPCPPENVEAMARIAQRSTTPIGHRRTIGRPLWMPSADRNGCGRYPAGTDINHVGGITGLWKVSQMASVSGISLAPHACEGPIGGVGRRCT